MIFETHRLKQPLSKFIESIFYYKDFQPDHSIERVVPTGHLFILFELDGIERNTFDNHTLEPNGSYRNVWISGMHKNYLSISAHPNSEMLVIQFKPYGAFPFLHIPIHQVNDKIIPAREIFGNDILRLREEVLNTGNHSCKFEIIEMWLENRMDHKKTPEDELLSILDQFAGNPMSHHNAIVKKYSKTQKNLIERYKKYCGLTPKVFHRIFRFNRILQQLQQNRKIVWPQIAYQFGYTDQSHFIKEFKAFSGFNPQDFIVAERHTEQPNFFPLDKKG